VGKKKQQGNGSGSVYPRKNKAGKITSYLGAYYGPDGKRRTVSGKTRKECGEKLRAVRQVIRRLVALLAHDVCPPGVEGRLNTILQLLKVYAQLTAFEIKEGPEEKPRGAFRREPTLNTQALEAQLHSLVEDAEDTHDEEHETPGDPTPRGAA
jgi:hypothetical protein